MQWTSSADIHGLTKCGNFDYLFPLPIVLCHGSIAKAAGAIQGKQLTIVAPPEAEHWQWIYDPGALDDQAIDSMMEQFQEFCRSAAADPSQPAGRRANSQ